MVSSPLRFTDYQFMILTRFFWNWKAQTQLLYRCGIGGELGSLKIDFSRLPLEIQTGFVIFVDGNLIEHSSVKTKD